MSQFQRIELLVGSDGLATLQRSFVVVVGLGAVGSYAVEALARAGIGRLRLIDHDNVSPSNINRQLFALWNTVGRSKSEVAAERVRQINPNCRVEALETFVHRETLAEVLDGEPDFVVDAIDSLNPKVELLHELSVRNQSAISSMGAALRTDPTRIRVGRLDEITHCPLAAMIRKKLRKRGVVPSLPCVYSTEPVEEFRQTALLAPEHTEQDELRRGRKRVSLGSLPTLTGIFGLTAANAVILTLLGRKVDFRR